MRNKRTRRLTKKYRRTQKKGKKTKRIKKKSSKRVKRYMNKGGDGRNIVTKVTGMNPDEGSEDIGAVSPGDWRKVGKSPEVKNISH